MRRQQLSDLREQTEFERRQRDYRLSGIILLALEEPEMPIVLIADRFLETPVVVQHALREAGVGREPDFFSDRHNGRRSAA